MQAQTPTVVARETPRGGVRLVFCERGYTSSSIWGYCFLQLPAKDALVPALIWVLSAGQYLLHHSICLPGLEVTQGHWNWCQSKDYVGFLFAFYSNYGRIFNHFGDIQRQIMAWPWNLSLGLFEVIENVAVRQIIYDFLLFVTIALSCTVCELFDVE